MYFTHALSFCKSTPVQLGGIGLTILCFLLFTACNLNAQSNNIDQKVEALLRQMTLEEKVGQMNQYNGFWEATGPVPEQGNAKLKYDNLAKGYVGSMLNVRGVEEVRRLQQIAVEKSRLGIPLIFASDVIHGYKTLAPIPLAEAASWDLARMEQSARNAAIEASAVGISWTFAPMVDISRDPRWGRVMEGGGEDPYLGSLIAAARVRGFQGDDLSAPHTILACAKHLAAYGFSEAGRDYNTVDVGTTTLYNVVFPPFKAAVDQGVRTVMSSFNILNGVPATGNSFLLREILKGRWNFQGFVISDWDSAREMIDHGYAANLSEVAVLAANAGLDMDMESSAFLNHLAAAVRAGKVKEEVVDEAVRRILRVKFELGLFDDPYRYCDEKREASLLYHPDHQADALEMAKRSIVLLKNENKLLPLAKDQQKIAVIGQLAADKSSPLGSWRIGSDDGTAVSVLEGLAEYTQAYTYAQGPAVWTGTPSFTADVVINETDRTGFEEAVALAKESEVVLMVLGEHGFQSGEARSRTELGLPGLQLELLQAVHAVNPNIVLILMNGRPLTIPWEAEHIPAILECWHLGSQSGHAIAQVLFGDYNPSGKLPMTFPRSIGQIPIYYNHFSTGRTEVKPHVFYTRYIDSPKTPLYPFGHGLSYTDFAYRNLQVNVKGDQLVEVTVEVENTGQVAGEEVIQVYLHDHFASVVRPVQELKGFSKIELQPGEARTLTFTLTDQELGFFNHQGQYLVEPGTFTVMVGGSSQKVLRADFELE
ncbi:MAG: beta-glucosidase BglX [Bacteroidetes bacterium]|nr:MAG: beta-glucosidase BglX [Bacteroidota bacterium]